MTASNASENCADTPPDPRSRPTNVRVSRNFIHHNQNWVGGGYGVVTGYGAVPLVDRNYFLSNRHAISADWKALTGYRALFNLVGSEAPTYADHPAQQDFDVHGTGTLDNGANHYGGTGGDYFEITGNTFLGTDRHNLEVRGTPCYLIDFHNNILVQGLGGGLWSISDPARFSAVGNQFGAPNPSIRREGDFVGNGQQDWFSATGAAWYYAADSAAEWHFLSPKRQQLGLMFADVDADGRTDVTAVLGGRRVVSWGGRSDWESLLP